MKNISEMDVSNENPFGSFNQWNRTVCIVVIRAYIMQLLKYKQNKISELKIQRNSNSVKFTGGYFFFFLGGGVFHLLEQHALHSCD
jgi:hypothetical protein